MEWVGRKGEEEKEEGKGEGKTSAWEKRKNGKSRERNRKTE